MIHNLVMFAVVLTRVDSAFAGRAYAAYGGVYIAASLTWLWLIEGQRPTANRRGPVSGLHETTYRRRTASFPSAFREAGGTTPPVRTQGSLPTSAIRASNA